MTHLSSCLWKIRQSAGGINNGLNIHSVLWERQIVLRWWNILHFPSLSLSMLLFSTRKTMYFRTVSRKRAISKFQYGWLTYRGSRYWSNSDTPNADTTKNPLERILLRHGKVSYYFLTLLISTAILKLFYEIEYCLLTCFLYKCSSRLYFHFCVHFENQK